LSLILGGALDSALAQTSGAPTGMPSTVVAQQGTAIVTLADIDAFAARIPEKERPGFFDNPTRLENLILQLLSQKQLAEEARKANLDKAPAVQSQIAMATDEVLSRARMENLRAGIKLPDFEARAKEEYIGHKEVYTSPGDLTVQHILISTKSRDDKDAKALADTVAKEAAAHPDQFEALVEKYSEDESKASNKGVMKGVTKATFVGSFVDASKALKKPGDISQPVKTKFGYHIIKLISRTPDKQQTYAEVHDRIVDRLKTEYVAKLVQDHVDQIRNQHIDANPDLVASLRTRYGTPTVADPTAVLDNASTASSKP
ncbi:MAG TPA: peptidylprolyl isomerase, partial [Rhodanobacteraceae bacterium]